MNIFIDAGFYVGNATKIYQEAGIVDKSWDVYAFEPYPLPNIDALLEARLPLKVNLIKAAAWIEDGEMEFVIKGREDAHHIYLDGPAEGEKVVKVPTIDFSKFITTLAPQGKTVRIIVSMDIEGAEFQVLEKMLEDGTIDNIVELSVEFHHRLLNDYTEKDAARLIRAIRKHGIKVKLKVPLN